ncbi:MAG: PAS domain S-box protein [Deltaproteobacteria bacterium]|nr:PAS domain S-box protein [Deltaproteobacteria bacterium]
MLVIDDDATTRRILEVVLRKTGMEILAAGSGAEGVALALEKQPELILLDLVMPAMDGFDVLAQLRANPRTRELAVVVLTALEGDDDIARAFDAGADDFLQKPFRESELMARIRGQMRLRTYFEEISRKEQDAHAMLELTQALASSLDFREILFNVVTRIAEVVHVDRCSIVLVRDAGDIGYVVATSDEEAVQNLPIDLAKYPEIREVLKTRMPVSIDDVETHPLLDEVRVRIAASGFSSLTLFPIIYEERAMGVLFLRAARKAKLSGRELNFCSIVSNATAVALRNARILQSLRDQTQQISFARHEAERRLRALQRYADFFTSAADGMFVVDASGRLLFANPSAARITGFSEDELKEKRLDDLMLPEDWATLEHLRECFAREEYPRGVDVHTRRRDGSVRVLSMSSNGLLHEDAAVVLTIRDVTDERHTEAELQKTKDFLEGLISSSVDAIVAADLKGKVILFNHAAERIYGYSAGEMVGKGNVRDLYPEGVAREVMRRIRSPEFGGEGKLVQMRTEALSKSGERIPIVLSASLLHEDGKPVASFGFFTDLRERIQIEQRLAQAQEKLLVTEKQAIIAELAGTAAHELNQPLTSVMGYAELIKRKLEAGSVLSPAADIIVREAERMAEIVRKIGKITRYETKSYVGGTNILDLDRASAEDSTPPPPPTPQTAAATEQRRKTPPPAGEVVK